MTCIVGIAHEGKVYIGGDSMGSTTTRQVIRKDEKVFQIEDMLFGFCASYRVGQLVRYFFKKPAHSHKVGMEQYMHQLVVPEIRRILDEHGSQHKKDDVEQSLGTFLIGYRGRLFEMDYDYQIGEPAAGYEAIGSGASVAIGSLYSTTGDPEKRIVTALEAAALHARGVGAPWVIGSV